MGPLSFELKMPVGGLSSTQESTIVKLFVPTRKKTMASLICGTEYLVQEVDL
jgi:hypothetical protein